MFLAAFHDTKLRLVQKVLCGNYSSDHGRPPKRVTADQFSHFTNTGVEHFGSFYVTVSRTTEKSWGFLFICRTTCAVLSMLKSFTPWTHESIEKCNTLNIATEFAHSGIRGSFNRLVRQTKMASRRGWSQV